MFRPSKSKITPYVPVVDPNGLTGPLTFFPSILASTFPVVRGQQFATKEIVTGRVRKHLVKTRRKLIMVKNDKEMVRVRCEGIIPALVPYVSQTKGSIVIRENNISGKQNILGKDKTIQGKVRDQMHKQFNVGVSKMKAFRAKRITADKMTSSFKKHYSLLRKYAQELINQNLGTTVRIDVQQEPNLGHPTRTFRTVYVCLGYLKQGFRACAREILGLDRCFMSGRAKCDLLLNNTCEVFNRQLVDGRDQPIITCLEYIREYLMKRIVVVQKVIAKTARPLTPSGTALFDAIKKLPTTLFNGMKKWELTRIPCKHVVVAIYNMSENSIGVGIPEHWVHAAYRLETWAHVYSFKINPCNDREM
nr:hypothetical protein [Tanacetum cinerariifolium]